MAFGKRLGGALVGTPLYQPFRFIYQTAFGRDAIRKRRDRKHFYAQFISPRDLVFDIGANEGLYSEAFCALGADVVSVEPDPRNLEILKKRLRGRKVRIEACAMGSESRTQTFYLSNRNDVAIGQGSTVSTLFPQYAENPDEGYSNITVQVRTLDWLREKYGAPKYVKIDTEGSDAEVIRGMSFQPAMLSFEFLPEDLSVARKCVEQLPDRRFNYVLEQQARYALEDWVTAEQISRVLEDVPKTVFYGDVFAR